MAQPMVKSPTAAMRRHGTVRIRHVRFSEAARGAAQAQHGAGQGALADPTGPGPKPPWEQDAFHRGKLLHK